MYSKPILNYR